ncbi:hypothetical protein [Miltoncostaea oceani]|uniref:hypothetical protein n=1 Tax=Miltoncostaea oceani TaxID=2843216 RepID=UPI001C3E8422|nr:hypothetical protein [Miltoncostaea oceani]
MNKASLARIITAHRRSYVHQATGRRLVSDHLSFELLPVLVAAGAVALILTGFDLPSQVRIGALALVGLTGAMLFAAFLFVSATAHGVAARMSQIDNSPREWSQRRTLLGEMAANSAYGVLVGSVAGVLFVVGSGSGWFALADGLAIGMGVHLALVFAMVMKRLMALTEGTLNETLKIREREPEQEIAA